MDNLYKIWFVVLASQCMLLAGQETETTVFDVQSYGATGDGYSDDTQAFEDAWKATCNFSESSPTMHIPEGHEFLLQPLTFSGPCKSNNITFLVDGKIIAPSEPHDWKCGGDGESCEEWIVFENLDGIIISGAGTIAGQGSNWWPLSCDDDKLACHKKPTALVISKSNNVRLNGLSFEDNPQVHISLEGSTGVFVSYLTIKAPGDSPNTDGIHIQSSTNIFVSNSLISTGDDCISIGSGTSNVNISDITCGPGHGISIGSLSKNGDYETVEYIYVKDIVFKGTSNGCRIKTWQGGKGYARYITFEHIESQDATRPIVIDQYYCPDKQCKNETSAVNIDNVIYSDVHGTSNKKDAVHLACSETTPCTNIIMDDIKLKLTTKDKNGENNEAESYCLNVEGVTNGNVIPQVSCLTEVSP